MTRLLVAAALVVMLAAAGVGAGAEWDVWKRVTLEGEGADVVTSCGRGKVIEN